MSERVCEACEGEPAIDVVSALGAVLADALTSHCQGNDNAQRALVKITGHISVALADHFQAQETRQ